MVRLIRHAKYAGTCRLCGKRTSVGSIITWERGYGVTHLSCHPDAETLLDGGSTVGHNHDGARSECPACARGEYAKGLADARRYQNDKKVFGPRLAEKWAAEEEHNRFWKDGEDY